MRVEIGSHEDKDRGSHKDIDRGSHEDKDRDLSTKTNPAWMVLTTLPVLPPNLRPLLELESGRLVFVERKLSKIRIRRIRDFSGVKT